MTLTKLVAAVRDSVTHPIEKQCCTIMFQLSRKLTKLNTTQKHCSVTGNLVSTRLAWIDRCAWATFCKTITSRCNHTKNWSAKNTSNPKMTHLSSNRRPRITLLNRPVHTVVKSNWVSRAKCAKLSIQMRIWVVQDLAQVLAAQWNGAAPKLHRSTSRLLRVRW